MVICLLLNGVDVVIVESFSWIFYCNVINNGFFVIVCFEVVECIEEGDCVVVDLD